MFVYEQRLFSTELYRQVSHTHYYLVASLNFSLNEEYGVRICPALPHPRYFSEIARFGSIENCHGWLVHSSRRLQQICALY